MPKYDTAAIKADIRLSEYLPTRGYKLTHSGREYRCNCPLPGHGGDRTPSFTIRDGKRGQEEFKCFGCGANGDVIGFVMAHDAVSFDEACDILGGTREPPENHRPQVERAPVVDIYAAWTPVAPPKGTPKIRPGERTPDLFNPKNPDKPVTRYTPVAAHAYLDAAGVFLGYVLRMAKSDGGKFVALIRWAENAATEQAGWCHHVFPEPRPLYGLKRLADKPGVSVLVVEGEKCADAANAAMPATVAVSWQGGGKAAGKADWSPLAGRSVVIWPDNDAPGLATAVEAAALIAQAGAKSVKIIDLAGSTQDKGWDVADAIEAGWTKDEIVQFIRAGARPWGQPTEPPTTAPEPTDDHGGRFDVPPEDQPDERTGLTKPTLKPVTQEKTQPEEESNPDDEPRGQSATLLDMRTRKEIKRPQAWDAEDLMPDGRHWKAGLFMDGKGNLKRTEVENWEVLLKDHPDMRGVFIQNEMTQAIYMDRRPPWEPADRPWRMRMLKKTDAGRAQVWMNTLDDGRDDYRQKSTVTGAKQAIEMVAERNRFHPVREYFERLEREKVWDGCRRVNTPDGVAPWLEEYMNAAPIDNGVLRDYGMFWLVGIVARNMTENPEGEKFDNMLVLEGGQGIGKSLALETIAKMDGKTYHTSSITDIVAKDTIQLTQGVAIAVCDEFAAIARASVEAVKDYLQRKCDKVRLPYAEGPVEIPRTFGMASATNPSGGGYLTDPTGSRRFWIIDCKGKIDIAALEDVRDQLWAEAVSLYRSGAEWWFPADRERLVEEENRRRFKLDEWAEQLDDWLAGPPVAVTLKAAFDMLPVHPDRRDATKGKRITDHLFFRGYRPVERKLANGRLRIEYVKEGEE